jgi:hypothetical protein
MKNNKKSYAEQWDENGYFICKDVFDKNMLATLLSFYEYLRRNQTFRSCPVAGKSTLMQSRFVIFESLLDVFSLFISEQLNSRYLPTLSNVRESHHGTHFKPHIDRESCEVTCSFPLLIESGHDWPLFVAKDKQSEGVPLSLSLGDVAVLKGREIFHWREPYSGARQIQVQLHYVMENGEYDEYKYDRQESLQVDMKKLKLVGEGDNVRDYQYSSVIQKLGKMLQKNLETIKHDPAFQAAMV